MNDVKPNSAANPRLKQMNPASMRAMCNQPRAHPSARRAASLVLASIYQSAYRPHVFHAYGTWYLLALY